MDTGNIDTKENSIDLGAPLRDSVKSGESDDSDNNKGMSDTDEESVSDGTFTCDGCGGMINADPDSTWYRCTYCDDTDFCHAYFIKAIHSHCKTHFQTFKAPANWNAPHCDACGLTFTDPCGMLFKCNKCEDYCLCHTCKSKLLHINHSEFITEETIQNYLNDNG